MLYLLIDGDGHHEFSEETKADLIESIIDLVFSNEDTRFKTTKHNLSGMPLLVIEVTPPDGDT